MIVITEFDFLGYVKQSHSMTGQMCQKAVDHLTHHIEICIALYLFNKLCDCDKKQKKNSLKKYRLSTRERARSYQGRFSARAFEESEQEISNFSIDPLDTWTQLLGLFHKLHPLWD